MCDRNILWYKRYSSPHSLSIRDVSIPEESDQCAFLHYDDPKLNNKCMWETWLTSDS